MSRWLAGRNLDLGLGLGDLAENRFEEFLGASRAEGYSRPQSLRGMSPLLNYLRDLGLVPIAMEVMPVTPMDTIIREYQGYLVEERGLAPRTVGSYVGVARLFLGQREAAGGEIDVDALTTQAVSSFVVSYAQPSSACYVRLIVTGLRSLFRFLYITGYIQRPLGGAVRSVAHWQLTSVPKSISVQVVAQLLNSCDRRTAHGLRDFAIITVLVRLGLRAGEVAALRVHDVDWRAGELTVRGKGNREDRLPLPTDVGEAVVAWLQAGRWQVGHPLLFTRVPAPHNGLSPSGISQVVTSACRRAGIPRMGAHRLRHTAATEMLRSGGSLADVGQVLRHQSAATTAIYAKIDRTALSAVTQPWPGGAA
jgi:site-specific recombinase XerD